MERQNTLRKLENRKKDLENSIEVMLSLANIII